MRRKGGTGEAITAKEVVGTVTVILTIGFFVIGFLPAIQNIPVPQIDGDTQQPSYGNDNNNNQNDASFGDGNCGMPSDAIIKTDFSSGWQDTFNDGDVSSSKLQTVSDGAHDGESLEVHIPADEHTGTGIGYIFQDAGREEPEELYAQYMIKFGENWHPGNGFGGKLPGFAGTYGEAGWGGRVADGTNGWSARGLFTASDSGDGTDVGYYTYHVDMGNWGSNYGGGNLENEQWYCVEQHIKLNTPGEDDGVLEAWVDGEKIVDKQDMQWRDISDLKIHRYWFDVYWGGGSEVLSQKQNDMNVYFDNFAVMTPEQAESSSGFGPEDKDKWSVDFEDDFNQGSLDTSKWEVGFGWGMDTDSSMERISEDEVSVEDDELVLGVSHNGGPESVTAGSVNTKEKHYWEPPVYFEAKLKTPDRHGLLPAFWAKSNKPTPNWPPEIDVFEMLENDPTSSHHNIHYDASGGMGGNHERDTMSYSDIESTTDYHVYGSAWYEDRIEMYVDGEHVGTHDNPTAMESMMAGAPFYIMLNIHVGKTGTPDFDEQWDDTMHVDWVRVWKQSQ